MKRKLYYQAQEAPFLTGLAMTLFTLAETSVLFVTLEIAPAWIGWTPLGLQPYSWVLISFGMIWYGIGASLYVIFKEY